MTKGTIRSLLFAGTIVAAASVASADPIIYDNGGAAVLGSLFSSQLDTVYPFDSQAADNFVLASNYIVTGVNWSGGWFNSNGSGTDHNATAFNIYFYADNGAGTAPVGGPGSEFASYNIAIGSVTVNPTGVDSADYHVDLGPGLSLNGGTNYWIAIQSVNVFPPQWGWASNGVAGNAVQGFPLLGLPYWGLISPASDMVFSLEGIVPAPGAVALLGMGGLMAARRRR